MKKLPKEQMSLKIEELFGNIYIIDTFKDEFQNNF